ncbi:hypothetical protein NMA58_10895 [Rhizobium sp. YTUHZ045]|uniref:hypothetical protein n=1 Tax=Rhizobium sp. YTUHZ045 TaxID=2962888 RepID=UPI003DA9899D
MFEQQGTACEDDENEDDEKMARPLSMILRPGFLAVSDLPVNCHSAYASGNRKQPKLAVDKMNTISKEKRTVSFLNTASRATGMHCPDKDTFFLEKS